MAQLNYSYQTPKGAAGGLYDLSPYQINSFLNGETAVGKLRFGMAVVPGANPGADVKAPAAGATSAQIEGSALTSFTQQQDLEGDAATRPGQTIGVLRYGKAWARIVPGLTIAYGDALYTVAGGDNAGLFTNVSASNVAVAGRFIGPADGARGIAPVELYNAAS
jgi:hypothetical protein